MADSPATPDPTEGTYDPISGGRPTDSAANPDNPLGGGLATGPPPTDMGESRSARLLELAVCLRNILGGLPDVDDISSVLNVSVKLDRMLALVQSFPNPNSIQGIISDLANIMACAETIKTTQDGSVVAALDRIEDKLTDIDQDIRNLSLLMTTERITKENYEYPYFRNEEWFTLGGALADGSTDMIITFTAPKEKLNIEVGFADSTRGSVTPIADTLVITANTTKSLHLPFTVPAGKYLRMRAYMDDYTKFETTTATSLRARVNTTKSKWGGHVYCHAGTPYNTDITYTWRYPVSTRYGTSYYDITNKDPDSQLSGADTNWLCFPATPIASFPSSVICEVKQRPGPDLAEVIVRSTSVSLIDTDLPVSVTMLS